MNNQLYKIKRIVNDLEASSYTNSQISLLQELIVTAEVYKQHLIHVTNQQNNKNNVDVINHVDMKIEKISQEVFLYKPITVKNYYDGDYLERFASIRTSDLKSSGVLDIHNRFWQAHEVFNGNIFASIPFELINASQSSKLQHFNWDKVQVDVYEITSELQSKTSRRDIINAVEKMFDHYILVREVCGNILMVLHYKL
ncbi:hypothetical protein [Natronincola ferrireducens]|uniref:Uncharacterized protein n=1 Tax=Natronincola ferrireducens TaxID=393762 RepID=A0A1G8Y808_9FIRM|nr:hypothetical protein [Natronincola ferrireducens]SDJ98928.1 hypothetical protein SAMN05660472_00458 [Natronincola ferrireducens]